MPTSTANTEEVFIHVPDIDKKENQVTIVLRKSVNGVRVVINNYNIVRFNNDGTLYLHKDINLDGIKTDYEGRIKIVWFKNNFLEVKISWLDGRGFHQP